MPGAISRTTGSATRWNSLTPSFMRHGNDHPLSVTMGRNGRPLGGGAGGWVAAEVCAAASGSPAAPARLTAAAPRNVAPAALKKVLRLVMEGSQCPPACRSAVAVTDEAMAPPGER